MDTIEKKDELVPEAKWYVIHTYSTYELAVRDNIMKMVENTGLQDQIFDVVVPQEEEIVETKTKRKTILRKNFPTYAFIKMRPYDPTSRESQRVYYYVTHIHAVTGFAGPGGTPVPLKPEDIRRLGLEKVKAEDLGLQVGDQVRIISGAFESYFGEVEGIDYDQGIVKVVLSMFGKPTPIELEFNQVEKDPQN